MATLDPKKLLNSSSGSGGRLTSQPKMFLVPIKNTQYKQTVDLSQEIEETNVSDADQKVIDDIKVIREKVVKIEDILKQSIKINLKKIQLTRKQEENQKRKKQEDKLEKKKDKSEKGIPKLPIPGMSFIDRIKQFLGTIFTGFLVLRLVKLLPQLVAFIDFIKPISDFIMDFAAGMFDKFIWAIDTGYKIVDGAQAKMKELFGDDGEKKFKEFTSTFTKFMNLAIIAGMATMGGNDPLRDRRFDGPQRRGFDRSGRRVSRGAQQRYRQRFGDRKYQERFGRKNLNRLNKGAPKPGPIDPLSRGLQRGVTKIAGKNVGRFAGRLPIVGPLIDFGIRTLIFKEPLGKAAAGAVGAGVGQALGTWLGGTVGTVAGSVVPIVGNLIGGAAGATIGGLLGGLIGDQIGVSLYNVINKSNSTKIEGRAEGGSVGGKRGYDPGKKKKKRKAIPIQKVKTDKTKPGLSIGQDKLKKIYGSQASTTKPPLSVLVKSSEKLKKQGSSIFGKVMSLGVDYVLGMKPSTSTKKSIAKAFAGLFAQASNPDMMLGELTRTFQALAEGGEVGIQQREMLRRNQSIIDLMRGIETALNKDFNILNTILGIPAQEPAPSGDYDQMDLNVDQQAAFEKIKKLAEKVGSPNPSVTAAIAMLETGWLANKNSVYWATNKTNPFGQTGRGPKGFVIGSDGQEHAIYNSLEEGVKAHVDRWGSSYLGRTPEEIIESIRTGKGRGAPGQYNTNRDWTRKVLGIQQSATFRPSQRPSIAAYRAILPEGNPQFSSGFGRRNVRWGSSNHQGIDIGVDRGSRVLSAANGTAYVLDNATWGSFGQAVVIDHGDGTSTLYGHVDPKVRTGTKVKKGDVIARVKYWPKGAYGAEYDDNTHLHFERRLGGVGFQGRAVDPSNYLNSLAPTSPSRQIAPVAGTRISSNGVTFFKGTNGKYYKMGRGNVPVEVDKNAYDSAKSSGTLISSLQPRPSATSQPPAPIARVQPSSNIGEIASLNYKPSYDQGSTTHVFIVEKTG